MSEEIKKWTKAPDSTEFCLKLRDENEGWSASVKWDGCIHFNRYYNGMSIDDKTGEDCDYIHICDVDEMIERLQELRAAAIVHFDGWADGLRKVSSEVVKVQNKSNDCIDVG